MKSAKEYAEIEKYCRECLEKYVISRGRVRFFSVFTIVSSIIGLLAISALEILQVLIFGLAHRLIELEIFLYGTSELVFDTDFFLLQAIIIGLWLVALLSLICYVGHRYSPCIIMIFAFPLIAVYSVVALVTGQGSAGLYVIILAYSVMMFAVQFITLHYVSTLEELKKEPGYPMFNPDIVASMKHCDDSVWDEISDDEKIMLEREGYYRGY